MELALPDLGGIDRAWREKAAHLHQAGSLGRHDVIGRAAWAEFFDKAAEILANPGVSHISGDGLTGGVPSKSGKEAIAREMPAHRLAMRHLVGFVFEVDRCGQGNCPRQTKLLNNLA